MTGRLLFIVAAVMVAMALGLVYLRATEPAPLPAVETSPHAAVTGTEPTAASPSEPINDSVHAIAGAANSEHEERVAFHARTRKFFAEAPAMPAAERAASARVIASDVDRYEGKGELAASEALLLRIALVRESVTDPAQRAQQIAEIEQAYREDTASRQAASAAQRDPMFELYKLRESAIAANVMAMEEIPGGLSRAEYLRQRLQAERQLLLDTTP